MNKYKQCDIQGLPLLAVAPMINSGSTHVYKNQFKKKENVLVIFRTAHKQETLVF